MWTAHSMNETDSAEPRRVKVEYLSLAKSSPVERRGFSFAGGTGVAPCP